MLSVVSSNDRISVRGMSSPLSSPRSRKVKGMGDGAHRVTHVANLNLSLLSCMRGTSARLRQRAGIENPSIIGRAGRSERPHWVNHLIFLRLPGT